MRFAVALAMIGLLEAANAQSLPTPLRVLALQGKTYHVQGIDTDGRHLWVTSVDSSTRKGYLHEFSVEDGKEERSVELQDGDRFHPGGIATDSASIWVPVAEYRARSSSVIQQRNKRTLALEFQFSVPDHIGCIAVTPDAIIGGNWDSLRFYVWNRQGKLLREVASETLNAYQDMKFVSGSIVASGNLAGRKGAVDWLDYPSFRLNRRQPMPNTDQGQPFTREGMTVFENRLWLLPEDGPSRLFVFPLPSATLGL